MCGMEWNVRFNAGGGGELEKKRAHHLKLFASLLFPLLYIIYLRACT